MRFKEQTLATLAVQVRAQGSEKNKISLQSLAYASHRLIALLALSGRLLDSSEFMSGLDNSNFLDTTVDEPAHSDPAILRRVFDIEVPNSLPAAIFH